MKPLTAKSGKDIMLRYHSSGILCIIDSQGSGFNSQINLGADSFCKQFNNYGKCFRFHKYGKMATTVAGLWVYSCLKHTGYTQLLKHEKITIVCCGNPSGTHQIGE